MKPFYRRWQFYVLLIIIISNVLDIIFNHNYLWLSVSTIIVGVYLIFDEIKGHPFTRHKK